MYLLLASFTFRIPLDSILTMLIGASARWCYYCWDSLCRRTTTNYSNGTVRISAMRSLQVFTRQAVRYLQVVLWGANCASESELPSTCSAVGCLSGCHFLQLHWSTKIWKMHLVANTVQWWTECRNWNAIQAASSVSSLANIKRAQKKLRRLEKTNAWPTDWWFQVFNPPHHQ